jgi:hypothetical protein
MTTNQPTGTAVIPSWPNPPTGQSRTQLLSFYENFVNKYYPGMWNKTRTPNKGVTFPYPQYNGKTYGEIATSILSSEPSDSPEQIAQGVAQQYLQDEAANALDTSVTGAAGALGDVATGIETASIVPSWADGLAGFLADLTNANLWIRVAKIGIGGTILVVGLAKLTGADQKIGGVAAKAVKIAPLL